MARRRLRIVGLGLLQLSLLTSSTGRAQNQLQSAKSYIPRLEKNLKENIIAFWLPRSLDREHGGYTINFIGIAAGIALLVIDHLRRRRRAAAATA